MVRCRRKIVLFYILIIHNHYQPNEDDNVIRLKIGSMITFIIDCTQDIFNNDFKMPTLIWCLRFAWRTYTLTQLLGV